MAWTGHYFKHSADGNFVTKTIEANNYFNLVSMLWNANTWIIPLIKLSYSLEHGTCTLRQRGRCGSRRCSTDRPTYG